MSNKNLPSPKTGCQHLISIENWLLTILNKWHMIIASGMFGSFSNIIMKAYARGDLFLSSQKKPYTTFTSHANNNEQLTFIAMEVQKNVTWAATTEKPSHLHISKFDLISKCLKSSNLYNGSRGNPEDFWKSSNTLSGHKVADIRKNHKVSKFIAYLLIISQLLFRNTYIAIVPSSIISTNTMVMYCTVRLKKKNPIAQSDRTTLNIT